MVCGSKRKSGIGGGFVRGGVVVVVVEGKPSVVLESRSKSHGGFSSSAEVELSRHIHGKR